MFAPTERTGSGDGPIWPWEHTFWSIRELALIVLIAVWAIAAIFAVLALALVDSLARAVLPPRIRDRYWHPSAQIPRNARPVAEPWLSANCGRQHARGSLEWQVPGSCNVRGHLPRLRKSIRMGEPWQGRSELARDPRSDLARIAKTGARAGQFWHGKTLVGAERRARDDAGISQSWMGDQSLRYAAPVTEDGDLADRVNPRAKSGRDALSLSGSNYLYRR